MKYINENITDEWRNAIVISSFKRGDRKEQTN
jgi:hypothetical protein